MTKVRKTASFIPINSRRTPCADKNDKLGWQDGFSLLLEGVLFGVRCNNSDLLARLRAKFPAHAQPTAQREVNVLLSLLQGRESQRRGVKNYHIVYNAWNPVARTLDLEEAITAFDQALLHGVSLNSQEKTYVHSPLVSLQKRNILLLHSYTLEEWAQWARAWQLQGGQTPTVNLTAVTPQAACCVPWDSPPPQQEPTRLILLEKAALKRPRWERITAAEVTMEMLRRTPASRIRPAQTMAALAGLAQKVPASKLRCASPAESARLLRLRAQSDRW